MLRTLLPITIIATLLVVSCNKEDDLDRLGSINAERPAAIGGTYLSGYQDGALYKKGQELSIPGLLFKQLEQYEGGPFEIPFLTNEAENGIGINTKFWESTFQTKSRLGTRVDCLGEASLGPVKEVYTGVNLPDLDNTPSFNGQYQCIPFGTLKNFVSPSFGLSITDGNTNPYYHRWAKEPGVSTVIGEINDYNPSFLLAWLGVDEILNYAISGGQGTPIPDAAVFKNRLDSILQVLSTDQLQGVIANIPAIHELPYFNLVAYNSPDLSNNQAISLNNQYTSSGYTHVSFQEGTNPFVMFDPTHPDGFRQMVAGEKLMLSAPLDSIKCGSHGLLFFNNSNLLSQMHTLTVFQMATIKEAIASYNIAIKELADKYDLAFYDAHAFFKETASGIKWNGADFDFEFVSGGFLSLDGLNPNQKGYALLTNGFIEAINQKYGSNIPNVNCTECDGVLFP